MFNKKIQLITQFIGTITLVFLSVYGLMGLADGSAAWATGLAAPAQQADEMSVPSVMPYEGYLRGTEGNPLSGYYTMTFKIYDDVVATTPLWEEEHNSVTVRDGYFSVLLGNSNPISATLFAEADRYIGVTVEPYSEMVPRTRLSSVPYAMQSYQATEADHALEADQATQAESAYALNAAGNEQRKALFADTVGRIKWGTKRGALLPNQGASIELGGAGTPYLDFSNDMDTDFDMRLILSGDDELTIGGGDLDVRGNLNANALRIDNKKPFIFQNYTGLGDNVSYDTGYSTGEYVCGIVGLAARGGDINEFGPVSPIQAYMYRHNGTWWIRADFATHCCSSENWQIILMCVDSDMAVYISE